MPAGNQGAAPPKQKAEVLRSEALKGRSVLTSGSRRLERADRLALYELEQFVAVLLHGLAVAGLDVEAEEGLGVRGTEVEPPVPVVDGEAVEVVDLRVVVLRVVLLHLLQRRFLVLDLAVDLPGADVVVYGG